MCLSCLMGPTSREPSGHSWGLHHFSEADTRVEVTGACQGKSKFREQRKFHYHAWNKCQNITIHSKQLVVGRGASKTSIDVFEDTHSLWDACDLAFYDIIN